MIPLEHQLHRKVPILVAFKSCLLRTKMAKRFLVIGLTSEVGYFMSIQDEVSIIIKNRLNKIIYIFKKLKIEYFLPFPLSSSLPLLSSKLISFGEGNGNPVWYPCLGNPMDRGVWQATVYGVTDESDTT